MSISDEDGGRACYGRSRGTMKARLDQQMLGVKAVSRGIIERGAEWRGVAVKVN